MTLKGDDPWPRGFHLKCLGCVMTYDLTMNGGSEPLGMKPGIAVGTLLTSQHHGEDETSE